MLPALVGLPAGPWTVFRFSNSYSCTQARMASSSFVALKSVDLYGRPAIVLSVSKTTLVISLNISWHCPRVIRRRPSIIAMSPPVPVPPIRSKYSHGLIVSDDCGGSFSQRPTTRCMNSSSIRREEKPLTPPPSKALKVSLLRLRDQM